MSTSLILLYICVFYNIKKKKKQHNIVVSQSHHIFLLSLLLVESNRFKSISHPAEILSLLSAIRVRVG